MKIQHNIAALNTHRNLNYNNTKAAKALEKLSSGYKINRAGDDAAGLAISEKMRSQIRGLDMASKNAQDGISLIQTAEGAMTEIHSMLQRGRELAVQAANDTNVEADRGALQQEIEQINEEINSVAERTEFNTKKILKGSAGVGADNPEVKQFSEKLISSMLETAEDLIAEKFGISPDPGTEIKVFFEEGDSDYNAFVRTYTDATGVGNRFEMYFNLTNMIENAPNGFEPDTTVAHEMTHAMMSASGMKWSAGAIPKWFKEGTAEYLSGGMDRVRGYLGSNPSATDITNFVSPLVDDGSNDENLDLTGEHYAAGFLATSYLDHRLSDSGGIKALMQDLAASPKSLDDAIKSITSSSYSLNQFLTDLKDPSVSNTYFDSLNYSGVGGILDDGSKTQETIIPDAQNAIDTSDGFTFIWDSTTGLDPNSSTTSKVYLQIGANEGQSFEFTLPGISTARLGVAGVDISTKSGAGKAISSFDNAIEKVSNERSRLGAIQNRLEHTINNLGTASENLTAAESRIRDTDMASEMMNFTKQNILMQAAQSMLAQANQQPQGVLQLLG